MTAHASEHGHLALAPIDRPRGLFLRLLYAATRRRYGRTPTAFRVVYARNPFLALAALALVSIMERCLRIERELRVLLQLSGSLRNGCTFCSDLVMAEAARQRIGKERFHELLDFESSPRFSERERAALAYAAAVHDSLHVSDAVHERLRAHFGEREIVEIVWVCAVERYFNGLALPLRIGSDGLSDPLLGQELRRHSDGSMDDARRAGQ
jgi:alkylhydroperoxidase family enzyme